MASPADSATVLARATELALAFLAEVDRRPVGARADLAGLRTALGGALPERGEESGAVLERLAAAADAGLVATPGPRYFGFVIGGSHPAALGADWLASTWDQNAGLYVTSPAAAVVEEVVAAWLIDLFGLPTGCSVGFTTGATMANFTALAAARHALLAHAGWDVEELGLGGAPAVALVTSAESHVTIDVSLQMLGLGRGRVRRVPTDAQGRMEPAALASTLAEIAGPAIVCAQAGNVSTGAFDPLAEIAPLVREHRGWLHVDGAFGLWAAATPELRHHLRGVELADSWTTDGHKWLNVPYDSGIVFVRDAAAHRAAMTLGAAYYVESAGAERDNYNWVPESSRRARGFPIWAVLRALGRRGVGELVERCARLARRMAERLRAGRGVAILNEVVLNQVLVRFAPRDGRDPDAWTREIMRRVQEEGTCWASGTVWHDLTAMRISVSNWSTSEEDIDRSAAAILHCADAAP